MNIIHRIIQHFFNLNNIYPSNPNLSNELVLMVTLIFSSGYKFTGEEERK